MKDSSFKVGYVDNTPEFEHDTAPLVIQDADLEILGRVDPLQLLDDPRRQGPMFNSPISDLDLRFCILICKLICKFGLRRTVISHFKPILNTSN